MQRNIDDSQRNAHRDAAATPAAGEGGAVRMDPACRNQERFWWIEMVGRNVPVYNCPMGLRIRGELDAETLRVAADLLADRHPMLRASVDMIDGVLQQAVMPPGALRQTLRLVDLSEYPADRRESALGDLIRHDLASFFDLSRAPLWRLTLFRLGPAEHHLHLNIHHVIHDAWSIGVLFRDLSQIYVALDRGEIPDLPVLSAGSAQPEPLSAPQREASEAYWIEKMRGRLPTLELPQDRARGREATFAGGNWQWRIAPPLLESFKRGATERGATLYMGILAAYSVFLHKLSGQTDLIVGTMFSGRRTPAEWPQIGCFSNTVALRLAVDPDADHEALLAHVRGEVLAAHVHQYYPLQDLVKAVSPEREVGRSVLFSTLLIFQNTMGDFERLFPGLEVTADYEEQYRSAAECDLFLQVRERDGGLQLNLEYNAELFERETVARFADVFDAVVEAMARDWRSPVRAGDALPATQKTLLLETWNDTAVALPLERNIVQRFAAQVAQRPDAVALAFEGREWRYAELDAHARAIASAIVAAGFGPGDIVGVHHRRNPGLVASLLGAMMAGCAYLPLDPKHPESRVGLMIGEARCRLIVAERACESRIRDIAPEARLLLSDALGNSGPAVALPDPATFAPESLAYVIFTSGSTGVPKGAAIEHRSLANLLSWAEGLLGHDRLAQVMATSSVCFDSSVFEIFTPLSIGGTVSLMESALHIASVRASDVLLSCAPSVASGLLQSGSIPDTVRTVVLAGEPVAESLVRKLYALPGVDAVFNFYGLSECAVYSTWALLDPDGPLPPPIGVPIANTTIYVLDADRKPVPIGAMGEIYIGGVGIGREYLNRPDLTAERFIPSPFRADDRLCRTGDLGRYGADGRLICLGRIDHQVKIRGYRIELGDVEEAICRHPDVRSSIVVAIDVPGTGRCLVGYYVAGTDAPTVDALRKHLYGMLPDYMVPSYLVPLAAIPLNSSGKVDRGALPPPVVESSTPGAGIAAPPTVADAARLPTPVVSPPAVPPSPTDDLRSRVERTLHRIWAQALQREQVDADAKLFEIGGHSLLLPLLRREIKTHLDVDLPLTQFFVSPTIRDMADVLTTALADRPASSEAVAGEAPRNETPDSGIAIIGFACRVPGASTPEALWRNLCEGIGAISEVPATRWNWRAGEGAENDGRGWPHARWGGWIDGVHEFEPEFFRLSAREARWMDPQQRLLLETAWEACERAGYRANEFGDGRVGLYVGASAQDYMRTLEHAGVLGDTYAGSGNALSLLSNRLSYLFGYSGPSVTIDTACSSSLVALHLARQALLNGEIDAALVAGTSLMLEPENMTIWGESGMLSADGRCLPFDAGANGFVAGEGVIAMTIKPLEAARRDGDQIWAILRGSAVNHDGSAKVGLTAPNPKAQRDVVRASLRSAGVHAGDISLVEAHGTGTVLGDPVEVQGLTEAFAVDTDRRGFCALTSMKGAIGHLGPAAGLASVLKVALALHHRRIPANSHLERPNPELRIEDSPFHLNPQARPWPSDVARPLAGVSSFGFGGVNAHVVIEAADAPTDPARDDGSDGPQLFTLSARTPSALRAYVDAFCALLAQGTPASMADVCFTVNRGRQSWPRRLAVVADRKETLLCLLGDWLAGARASGVDAAVFCEDAPGDRSLVDMLDSSARDGVGALCGGAVADRIFGSRRVDTASSETVAAIASRRECLRALASLYVQGVEIHWSKWYASANRRRVLLPTYPFERRDCSVPRVAASGRPPAPARAQVAAASVPASPDAWMRRIDWAECERMPDSAVRMRRPAVWLVFADDDRSVRGLADAARTEGTRFVLVTRGAAWARVASDHFRLDPCAARDYDQLFETLEREGIRPTDVVQAWHGRPSAMAEDASGLDSTLDAEDDGGARPLLLLCQGILRHWPQHDLNLRLVTRGAMYSQARLGDVAPAQAIAWGLARTIARECHRLRMQAIDLDRFRTDDAAITALARELRAPVRESEIALHGGRRLVPSIRPVDGAEIAAVPPLREGGVYLIAGGVGGIGRVLARFLGQRYRARVVLVSRRASDGFDPGSEDGEAIRRVGGTIDCIDADIADLRQCRDAVERIVARHGALHGVFHLAGVLDRTRVADYDWGAFENVLRAKTRGASNLDLATRHLRLDCMVLFSSLAGLAGNVFQAGYSAANRFLDAFAFWRTRQGRPTMSIDWGGWSGVGMGLTLAGGAAAGTDAADSMIAPDRGMALLERAMRSDLVQIAIAAPEQLDALLPVAPLPGAAASASASGHDAALSFLRRTLADVLEVQEASLDGQTPFLDLGVDSINSAWLVAAIDAATGTRQRRTLFFEYPTLDKLATALSGLTFRSPQDAAPHASSGERPAQPRIAADATIAAPLRPAVRAAASAPGTASVGEVRTRDVDADGDAIAIVGVAGRFPRAPNLEALWSLLRDGRDVIGPAPLQRWSDAATRDRLSAMRGGFFEDIDGFDAKSFNISPVEAESMDPQQRMLLEEVWCALENAAIAPGDLVGSDTGVFVGASASPVADRDAEPALGPHTLVGSSVAILANRLSYFLDLNGPSVTVDTLCSSSLAAVHMAVQSLLRGECGLAIVGGVRVGMPARYYEAAWRIGALSTTGVCRAFGRDADGMVPGEGLGVVVLKPLSRARADGDHIHAVIRGSAMNHGGRSSGLAAPNPQAQSRVVRAALDRAGIDAGTISLIEAHGTGTELGDPIEFDGLCKAFQQDAPSRQSCAIGSIKTNLGHLEPAAGIAGLLKLVLALKHRQIPPTLNAEQTNPNIDFGASPFRLNRELTPWDSPAGVPRRAGVSAFGIGGVNVHVVIEEHAEGGDARDTADIDADIDAGRGAGPGTHGAASADRRDRLIVLSARSEDGLSVLARELRDTLVAERRFGIDDIAHTLARGRVHWPHRRAFVCADRGQLVDVLARIGSGESVRGVARGHAPRNRVPKIAFLFPGQSSELYRAGDDLFRSEPVFRECMHRCDAHLRLRFGISVVDALYSDAADRPALTEARHAQPALFALAYSTAKWWQSLGIAPTAVLGHSLGEFVAATIAGALTLDDALDLVASRAVAMQTLSPQGGMIAVGAEARALREALDALDDGFADALEIAVYNAPSNTVLSGPLDALQAATRRFEDLGWSVHPLSVTHAFHSRAMVPALDRLPAVDAGVPRIAYASSLHGAMLDPEATLDRDYWRAHMREPVRYFEALRALIAEGYDCFFEFGAADVLSRLGPQIADDPAIAWCPALKRGRAARDLLLDAAAAMFVRGADRIVRDAVPGDAGCRIPLPGSPFERRQFSRPITIPASPVIGEHSTTMHIDPSAASHHAAPARRERSRVERLTDALILIFAEALHAAPDELDANLALLELGADSLALGNVTRVLRQRYGVRIATRQLFMEMTSIADVARVLDRELPPDFALDDGAEPLREAPIHAGVPAMAAPMSAHAQTVIAQTVIAHDAPASVAPAARAPGVPGAAAAMTSIEEAASRPYIPFQPFKPSSADQPAAQVADTEYLRGFVDAFTAKTRRSKEYAAQYRPVLADSRATTGFRLAVKEMLYPVVGQRSRGARVWDLDGNEYVDITMGYGVHLFGHGAPFLQEAIARQLEHGVQVGPQSEHAGQAAALLCEITGNERVAFCNSGTEANMLAIRLARNATGRPKIAIFEGCYHGFYDATLIVAGRRADGGLSASPMAPGLPRAVADDVIVLPYGADEALDIVRAHAHELAGILVEPVQSRRPSVQPVDFLHKLRALTSEAGIALIFDEVITGFRVHPGGAQAAFGIRADMAVYGKVVGGGMPIGAVGGKAWLLDGVDGGTWRYGDATYPEADQTFFATTFGKHPLVMATTLAALREIKRCGPELHAQLTRTTDAFVAKANALFERHGVNIRAQNFSSQFRFISPGNIDIFYYHLSMHGVFVWEGRNFFLSTAHTQEDIDTILAAVERSLSELVPHGLLPVVRTAAAAIPGPVGATPAAPVVARKALETREFPLSDAQREILVSTRLGGTHSASYNEPLAIVLKGALDPMALRDAFQTLVDRHDVLRSSVDADLRTQRSGDLLVDVPFVDLAACPREMLAATLSGQLHAAAAQPFDFSSGPMIRAQLWRCAATHHVLLLTVHHSAADATSFNVLLGELCALYARSAGMSRPALAPAMQYESMVETWASPVRLRDREDAAGYWMAQYADAVPVVRLPRDRNPGSAASDRGARQRIAMSGHLARAVTRRANEMGATPFVVLFAAFNAWLHRLTDQDDLVVGVPASLHPGEATGLVGHCINLVPVRMRAAAGLSLRDLVESARERILDAYDHAEYPFADLVRRLDLGKEARRSPLVQVQFNMDPAAEAPAFADLKMDLVSLNEPMTPLDLSDLGAGEIEFDSGIAKFDLSINLQLGDDHLRAVLEYRTDQFDDATIAAWSESLQIMLEDMIDMPEAPISSHRLVGPQQRRRLRGPQPVALADPAQPALLHARLRAQAERTPRAIAITDGAGSIAYADLAQRAFRIAHRLRASGVGEGEVVGVCASSDIDRVAVAWAALEIGAAYAWLAPEAIGESAKALRVLVVRDDVSASTAIDAGALDVIDLDREADSIAALPATSPAAMPDDPERAAVSLPGGGTGRVRLSHRSLCGAVDAVRDDVDLDGSDTCAVLCAPASDPMSERHWMFWNALTRGAHLIAPPASVLSSASAAYAWLCSQEISAVCFSPAMFSQVATIVLASRRSALRLAIVLGACESSAAKAWISRFGENDPKVVALHGPVEAGWTSLRRVLQARDAENDGACLIGAPLADTEAFVLDAGGRLLPTGVVGELHLASLRPFAEHGVGPVHPFAPGVILSPTGLRARRRADGRLESVDAMAAHAMAADAATADAGIAGDAAADAVASAAASGAEKGAAPTTETERLVAAVWSQILLTEVVSVDDDFFALGGDSLLAIRVVSLLSKQHGVNANVHDLFDTSTLGEFAMLIDAADGRLRPMAAGVEVL
ncbi:non-ribosomal peptide synthetase/type I polyketide synthase [Lysobacter hankyongensis]|uniref:Amino acid adenylation domain-containing protein n=1 Tax=Lysobacter hankyongensis TaxID=1176535 RepID=A0ABP9AK54_9GAMM